MQIYLKPKWIVLVAYMLGICAFLFSYFGWKWCEKKFPWEKTKVGFIYPTSIIQEMPGHLPVFQDVSSQEIRKQYLPSEISGNIALADVDQNGYVDFIVDGRYLFLNFGSKGFRSSSMDSGLNRPMPSPPIQSKAGFCDIDNDGYPDLMAVTGSQSADCKTGCNVYSLFLNGHDGTFRYAGEPFEITGAANGALAFYDFNGDGLLDFYISRTAVTTSNFLVVNHWPNPFEVIPSNYPKIQATRDAIWFDADNDGRCELFVANDNGKPDELLKIQPDGLMEDIAGKNRIDGMGVEARAGGAMSSKAAVAGDFDNDGFTDLFVAASFHPYEKGDHSRLYRNRGPQQGGFENATDKSGLVLHEDDFDAQWADINNDGNLDLTIIASTGAYYFLNNGHREFIQISRNNALKEIFLEAPPLSKDMDVRRVLNARWFDFNNDGYLDLLLIVHEPAKKKVPAHSEIKLFQNLGVQGFHWIAVKLVGKISNRDGLGARVEVKAMNKIMSRTAISPDIVPLYFGLGNTNQIDYITIYWPSRIRQTIPQVDMDKIITVVEESR